MSYIVVLPCQSNDINILIWYKYVKVSHILWWSLDNYEADKPMKYVAINKMETSYLFSSRNIASLHIYNTYYVLRVVLKWSSFHTLTMQLPISRCIQSTHPFTQMSEQCTSHVSLANCAGWSWARMSACDIQASIGRWCSYQLGKCNGLRSCIHLRCSPSLLYKTSHTFTIANVSSWQYSSNWCRVAS